ncbi:MAG: hypothetical protein PF904_17270 [Kiritimatiellae bacterium]|jgi:hypothetical protein|nr:hypothetical protein [Kiritimatiellia bacterium]
MSLRRWINQSSLLRAIKYEDQPLGFFVDKLNNGEIYSFSRFGDGEWSAVLDHEGENCDGHTYFPELGEQLRLCLLHPKEYCLFGMQPLAMRLIGRELKAYLKKEDVDIPWYNSDVFHDANKKGELYPLVQALRNKKVVIIGPKFLSNMDESVFSVSHFIQIPEKNCFLAKEVVKQAILDFSKDKDGVVYAFSASMMANVLIDELSMELGATNWLIDFGSLWDVYVSVKSRSVYRKMNWEPLIQKNLNG